MSERPQVQDQAVPALARGVKLRFDKARDAWVLLAPEKVLMPDQVAVEILKRCDGKASVTEIVEDLVVAFSADPSGGSLDTVDRAVVTFASKVAQDAAAISQGDVDALRAVGLSDNDIADVVFAAAARAFFAKVLDGVGATADHQLAAAFDPAVVDQVTVGRQFAPLTGG